MLIDDYSDLHLKAKKEMKAPPTQKHGKVKVSKLIGENAGAAIIDIYFSGEMEKQQSFTI